MTARSKFTKLATFFTALSMAVVSMTGAAFSLEKAGRDLSYQAATINARYNEFEYVADDKQKFTDCMTFLIKGGDCEEFALCKAEALNRKNPENHAVAQVVRIKATGQEHAITVFNDAAGDGGRAYLDNRSPYGGRIEDAKRLYDFTDIKMRLDEKHNKVMRVY